MRTKSTPWLRKLAVLAIAGALPLAGCGDDDPSGPETPDLAGTYELVSITFQGQPALGPPTATGTFTLTATTYAVDILINLPDPMGQHIQDQGSYSLNGTNWSQESSVNGTQAVGSFTFDGTRLEVSATTQGQTVTTIWDRIP